MPFIHEYSFSFSLIRETDARWPTYQISCRTCVCLLKQCQSSYMQISQLVAMSGQFPMNRIILPLVRELLPHCKKCISMWSCLCINGLPILLPGLCVGWNEFIGKRALHVTTSFSLSEQKSKPRHFVLYICIVSVLLLHGILSAYILVCTLQLHTLVWLPSVILFIVLHAM